MAGPISIWLVSSWEETWTPETPGMCPEREDRERIQGNGGHLQAKERGPQETSDLLTHWPRAYSLQNCEEIKGLLFKPPSLWYCVMAAQGD